MPRCDEQYVNRSPPSGASRSFDGRGLRYSESSLPPSVSKKYMLPVSNWRGPPDRPPVFVVVVGQPSPKDSSMKLATLPSHENVAECQKSTLVWSYAQAGFAVSGSPVSSSMF